MATDTFSMFLPQGVLGKGGFGSAGDARLEMVWKAEGISQSCAGVKCMTCASQSCEVIGMWSAQTSLLNPEGEISTGFPSENKTSYIIKDEVLGQDCMCSWVDVLALLDLLELFATFRGTVWQIPCILQPLSHPPSISYSSSQTYELLLALLHSICS